MFEPFLPTLLLTLKLALITTLILFFIGLALAYLLAFVNFPAKSILEVLISLPLVLPPSVLGFYLLITFSAGSPVGAFLAEHFELRLVFSFEGLVFASIIYSLPFMVHPLHAAFAGLDKDLLAAAATLGSGRAGVLFRIILPNSKAAIFSGLAMSFAHTMGEFGVVMMIGGHKSGQTLVASIAIYDELEALNYPLAHAYSLALVGISFALLLALHLVKKR